MNRKLITITFIVMALALMIVPASATNGSIYIKSLSPELNLDIYLDGEHVGLTTHLIEDIAPGTYEMYIEEEFNKYVPVTKTITVEDGEEYYEEILFERQGTLIINSDPSEAYIFINGTLAKDAYMLSGTEFHGDKTYLEEICTPAMIDLPFGVYEITIAKDGYAPSTQIIEISTVRESKIFRRTLNIILEEDPDYVVPTTDVTNEEDVSESTDTESTETSKESPGFTGMLSVILLGCVGFLLRKRTE